MPPTVQPWAPLQPPLRTAPLHPQTPGPVLLQTATGEIQLFYGQVLTPMPLHGGGGRPPLGGTHGVPARFPYAVWLHLPVTSQEMPLADVRQRPPVPVRPSQSAATWTPQAQQQYDPVKRQPPSVPKAQPPAAQPPQNPLNPLAPHNRRPTMTPRPAYDYSAFNQPTSGPPPHAGAYRGPSEG